MPYSDDYQKMVVFVKLQYQTDWIKKAKIEKEGGGDCERPYKKNKSKFFNFHHTNIAIKVVLLEC